MRFHRRRQETTIPRSARRTNRLRARQARTLELLEGRELLAGDLPNAAPWQNPVLARDVNFDLRVTPHDALLIINDLLSRGSHGLDDAPVSPLTSGGSSAKPRYLDVSGDNKVTPYDALLVVNALAAGQLMMVETVITDLNDVEIDSINQGEHFRLVTNVMDIRSPVPTPAGVYSAAVDVSYSSGLSSMFDAGLTFDPFFNLPPEESFAPGRISGYAATGSFTAPGAVEQTLFSVEMVATGAGFQTFMPGFSHFIVTNENGLFGRDDLLIEDEIMYMGNSLTIIATQPVVNIQDVSQLEASGTFLFNVTMTVPSEDQVIIQYFTSDGSAHAADPDNDYESTNGFLTFDPGVTMLAIPVTVNNDGTIEDNETFLVDIVLADGDATIGRGQATGEILNDDSPPALIISNAVATAGTEDTVAVFTVSITGEITQSVTVGYATQDNTAHAGVDYAAVTGSLTFDPGDPLSQEIPVTVFGNTMPQSDLTFFVNLSSGSIPIDDDRGVGTIVTQGITVSDASVVEGNSGTTPAVFTVSLSRESTEPVMVAFITESDTATAGSDFAGTSGTLTFSPGDIAKTVTVLVNGDTDIEGNERFNLRLSNAVGAPLFDDVAVGTIRNDDGDKVGIRLEATDLTGTPLPLDSALDVGESFFLNVFVQDLRAEPTGVASAYLDISYPAGLVTPDAGSLMFGTFYTNLQTFDFEDGLLNDFGAFGMIPPFNPPIDPSAEFLLFRVEFTTLDVGLVNFEGSVNEDELDPDAQTFVYGTDDPLTSGEINLENRSVNVGTNVIAAANVSAPESNNIVFAVTRFLPSDEVATVVFSTSSLNGTATAGDDYLPTSGTLTFQPGDTDPQFVTVTVIDDTLDEDNETFSLVLSNAVNATTSTVPATGTIEDNDGPVSVSVASASGPEGSFVVFTVSLSSQSGRVVTVAYNTADALSGVLATAGVDYTPTSGILTFNPGVVQRSISVQTLGDIATEPDEVFRVELSSPVNATVGTAAAQGTIFDVPPAGISGHVYLDMNNNGIKDASENGIAGVTVTATRAADGSTTTAITDATGAYSFPELFPGTYTITETQPGFYLDGRDARFGVESPVNDRFVGVVLAPSAGEAGFNFGERGVRSEFISAFLNRRALFASAVVGGMFSPSLNMPGTTLNLQTGEVWVSFDGGWDGLRVIEAAYNSAQGVVTMKLYNNALQQVALSAPTSTGSALLYNGQSGSPYFLRISGTNHDVSLSISEPVLPLAAPATSGDSGSGGTSGSSGDTNSAASAVTGRFASSAPAAVPLTEPTSEPLASTEASDEALADESDWLLGALLA